ncbi:MAG: hypothetical protein MUO91_07855 [candidate division Zixibacteria bacterium]|nr:hypothetical protein [candidate division Zixibacteria bacterium]
MNRFIFIFGLIILVFFASLSLAGIPKLINYQGMLTGSDGKTPVTNGNYSLTFKIYGSESGTDSLWREYHSTVLLTNGLFSVILGGLTTLNLPFDTTYWLGIKVGTDPELSPRAQLTSVGYAYRAAVSDSAIKAISAGSGGGWTDDGTVVRLTTVTDKVGIGTTAPQVKLSLGTDLTPKKLALWDGVNDFYGLGVELGRITVYTNNTEKMTILANGNVGIGTTSPGKLLHLYGAINPRIMVEAPSGQPPEFNLKRGDYAFNLYMNSGNDLVFWSGGDRVTFTDNGNVGIGTTSPEQKLHVAGIGRFDLGGGQVSISTPLGWPGIIALSSNGHRRDISFNDNGLYIATSSSASGPSADNGITILENGNVGMGTTNTNPSQRLTVRGNILIVSASTGNPVVELGEGLDYAEGFNVSDESEIAPGAVLVIDPDNPGKLALSQKAYDSKVAGIVAGAKGLGSGVRLGVGQFDYNVALAGRVYCNVDATYGEVSPGDLLTTSPTPGYAMVVKDHTKAQGAILGKAMEKLTYGEKRQILVLVTLQ